MWIDDVIKDLSVEFELPINQTEEIVNYQFKFLKDKLREFDKDDPETFKDIYLMHLGTFSGNKKQAYHRIEKRNNIGNKNSTVSIKKIMSGFEDEIVLPEFIIRVRSKSLVAGDIIVNKLRSGINPDYLFETVEYIEEQPAGFIYKMKYADESPNKEANIKMFTSNKRYGFWRDYK